MPMAVDEPGDDDEAGRVDDLGINLAVDARLDGGDRVASIRTSPDGRSPTAASILRTLPPLMRVLITIAPQLLCLAGW